MSKSSVKAAVGNLALLLMSLVVSVFLCEFAVRIFMPQEIRGSWTSIGPYGTILNRESGKTLHEFRDRRVVYEFSAPHLRGPAVDPLARVRVLTFGDSFTFGWLLDWKDTYVNRLEQYATAEFGPKSVQFLGGASPGKGIAEHLIYLNSFGDQIAPDVVLYFLNSQDSSRSMARGYIRLDADGKLQFQDQTRFTIKVAKALLTSDIFDWITNNSQLYQFLRAQVFGRTTGFAAETENRGSYIRESAAPDGNNPRRRALAEATIDAMNEWCKAHGAQLWVTTAGMPLVRDPWVEEFMAAKGIPFMDLSPIVEPEVQRDPVKYIISGDGHSTEQGAKLIADAAWDFVKPKLAELYAKKSTGSK